MKRGNDGKSLCPSPWRWEWQGRLGSSRENPIPAIFCRIFLGINPPVEKSWQETGKSHSRKRRKIIGMVVFSKILPPLVMGEEALSHGILEFLRLEKPWRWSPTIPSTDPEPQGPIPPRADFNPSGNGNSTPALGSSSSWEQHPKYSRGCPESSRTHGEGEGWEVPNPKSSEPPYPK